MKVPPFPFLNACKIFKDVILGFYKTEIDAGREKLEVREFEGTCSIANAFIEKQTTAFAEIESFLEQYGCSFPPQQEKRPQNSCDEVISGACSLNCSQTYFNFTYILFNNL